MTQTSPVELLREAMAAVRAKDRPRTRALLIEATRLDPKNETAWQWLAGVAENALEATQALEKVLTLNPANEKAKLAIRPVRLQAGIAAAKAKDASLARRLLRASVADEPNSEHGWLWLASVAESPVEAIHNLKRVLAINPSNPSALKGMDYYRSKMAPAPAPAAAPNVPPAPVNRVSNVTPMPTAAPTSRVPQPTRRLPPQPKVKQVLVVDDSRTIRKLVSMTMAAAGFKVVEAEDGSEAVNRIREDGVPDLILLDVAMPGMDGYEFCRLMRSSPETKTVPVIMLTGKDGFFDKIRGKLAGTSAYLAKPLQPKKLLETVERLIPLAVVPQ